MLITRGFWPPLWHGVFPAEDRAFVHRRPLMTVILNTHRMLSRFCLHSYQNEVLGGPHLSITAGLQLFASLWPGFNSQAYKLSLNGGEQGPFNPLLSPSPDKCSSVASPRHMPSSCLLLAPIRWPALHCRMARWELVYPRGCWKPSIRQSSVKQSFCQSVSELLQLFLSFYIVFQRFPMVFLAKRLYSLDNTRTWMCSSKPFVFSEQLFF